MFHVTGSPDLLSAPAALVHEPDGGLLVDDDGRVAWSGAWSARPPVDADVIDHHGCFLLPGFIDTHLHFPQVHCVDAYGGGQLLAWLEEQGRARGCHTFRLETGIHQHEALAFYASCGYQRRSPFGDYPDDPLSVFMEKRG